MKTEKPWANPSPSNCGLCKATKIPLVQSGIRICPACDGWPPKLEPPGIPLPARAHVQGCGQASDPSKRCICPWNR